MRYYKAASTNKNKGYKTHGSFKHDSRTKPGSGGSPNKEAPAKEKLAKKDPIQAKLRKISKGMFGKGMTKNGDVAMRAQYNA